MHYVRPKTEESCIEIRASIPNRLKCNSLKIPNLSNTDISLHIELLAHLPNAIPTQEISYYDLTRTEHRSLTKCNSCIRKVPFFCAQFQLKLIVKIALFRLIFLKLMINWKFHWTRPKKWNWRHEMPPVASFIFFRPNLMKLLKLSKLHRNCENKKGLYGIKPGKRTVLQNVVTLISFRYTNLYQHETLETIW